MRLNAIEAKTVRNIGFAGALLLGATTLEACGNVVDYAPCAALTGNGHRVTPNSYPTGTVTVEYQAARFAGNEEDTTQGLVTDTDGVYQLDVKGIPSKLANDYTNFFHTNAAIILKTPQTGEIGFTQGCITRGPDSAGIPSTFVDLPTSTHQ